MDGNGRSGFLFFVWSPAGYTLVERAGDPPRPGTEVEDGEQALPRDEDRAVAAAGRPAPVRVPAARLTLRRGRSPLLERLVVDVVLGRVRVGERVDLRRDPGTRS